jgi:hypothetical protein
MNNEMDTACDHVLELAPEAEVSIAMRFEMSLTVGLVRVDTAAGTAELVLDNMWRGYTMQQFDQHAGRWKSIWPGTDSRVHVVIRFGSEDQLNVSSDLAVLHSIDLKQAEWRGESLRLVFRESV